MQYIPNKIDMALLLWNDGDFIATKMDEVRISLYKYNGRFYVIWYTPENLIDKVEIVDKDTAKKLFNDFTE